MPQRGMGQSGAGEGPWAARQPSSWTLTHALRGILTGHGARPLVAGQPFWKTRCCCDVSASGSAQTTAALGAAQERSQEPWFLAGDWHQMSHGVCHGGSTHPPRGPDPQVGASASTGLCSTGLTGPILARMQKPTATCKEKHTLTVQTSNRTLRHSPKKIYVA